MSLAGSSAEGETFICKLNDPTTDISATESGSAPGLTITGSTITGGTKTSTTVTDVTWDGSDSGLWVPQQTGITILFREILLT